MFITDKELLKKYSSENRIWQGIPSIEVTKNGRIFSCFYSGGTREALDNYAMLVYSDNGTDFTEPVAVAYLENHRCFDPCLWIDPLGRLWFTWSAIPDHGTYAVICDNPDAPILNWSDVRLIGHDVMMNKPTVLSSGEWLFPIAVWNDGIRVLGKEFDTKEKEKGSFAYKTIDNGVTFEKVGCSQIKNRDFDEHMIIELDDGYLAMYVRTRYGIGVSYSYDNGKSWTVGEDSGFGKTVSRFFIRRLPSGRFLLVYHDGTASRNNLTAYLSEDGCRTWKYKLLLDERENVSYPDAAISEDGYIYIVYDRERGADKKNMKEAYECAREILYAKITEDDIMAGVLVSKESKLRCIISKLGIYNGEEKNPFCELEKFTDSEFANYIINKYPDNIIDKILDYYSVNCMNMHKLQNEKFDELVNSIEGQDGKNIETVTELITLVRSVTDIKRKAFPVVDIVKKIITENIFEDLSVSEIAKRANVSQYYMMHQFKKATGTKITEYKTALKLTMAKKLLLSTDKSVTEIAQECGFGDSSYFGKIFIKNEHVSPLEYRNMLTKR